MSKIIFKQNLKYLMKKRGFTPSTLANKLRVKLCRVNAWIDGRAYPRMPEFSDLCDALDYSHVNILTINVQRIQKGEKKKALPEDVSRTLKNIVEQVNEVLEK